MTTREDFTVFLNGLPARLEPEPRPGFFRDWKDAHAAAVHLARHVGREVGLERLAGEFRVFTLPAPEHRQGHELLCEVVGPGDPL
jgi:hypothetical protein